MGFAMGRGVGSNMEAERTMGYLEWSAPTCQERQQTTFVNFMETQGSSSAMRWPTSEEVNHECSVGKGCII